VDRFPAFSVSLLHGARAITAVLINLDSGFTKQCARVLAGTLAGLFGMRQQPHLRN